jgi:WD40 repeat protein
MASLLEIGLANAVCAAALAVLALAVGRWLRRPAVLHALWLLVLVKLITPPLFPLPLRVLPARQETAAAAPVTTVAATVTHPETDLKPSTGQFLVLPSANEREVIIALKLNETNQYLAPSEPLPAPAPIQKPASVPPAASTGVDWGFIGRIVIAVWLAGSAAWFAVAIVRMVRFQRLLTHGQPAPLELEARAWLLARHMGLADCPEIALIPGLVPPLLWMVIGRPKIYLPADLLGSLDATERDTLLAHELAHVRRRDHWVRWPEFVVQGVYWWNPLVPLARRQVQAHEEECCDALVVDMLPARSYASAIVQTLDFLAGAVPLPAPASGLRRVSPLKYRLTRILDGRNAGRLGIASRIVLGALALGLLPMLPSLAQSSATPTRPAATVDLTVMGDMTSDAAAVIADDSTDDTIVETPLSGDSPAPRVFAYAPDGQLALALEDHTIEIRESAAGKRIRTLRGHAGPVNCLAFSANGDLLATGSSDRTVRLWDARTGELRGTLKGHGNWVYALAFAPDGRTLASGGYDRSIRIWDTSTRSCRAVLKGHESAVRTLAFAPDGMTLASGGGDQVIRLWDIASRKQRLNASGHNDTVRALAFTADGQTLASASDDGTARLWDARSGTARMTLAGHFAEVTSLTFAPWGQILVTGGLDRMLRWWDVKSGRQIAVVPASKDGVIGFAFSPDRERLTSLGQDRQIRHMPLSRVSLRMPPAPPANSSMAFMEKPYAIRRAMVARSFTPTLPRLSPASPTSAAESEDAPRILIVEIMRESHDGKPASGN